MASKKDFVTDLAANPFKDPNQPRLGAGTGGTVVLDANRRMVVVNTQQAIQAQSYGMFPEEVARYTEWARAYPTADPRAWVALADASIHPASPDGQAFALADITRQVQERAADFGESVEQPRSMAPAAQGKPALDRFDARRGAERGAESGVQQALAEFDTGPFGLLKAGVNMGFGLLSTGYDALMAAPKILAGEKAEQDRIADEFGIPESQREAVFAPVVKRDATGAGVNVTAVSQGPRVADIKDPALRAKAQQARDRYKEYLDSEGRLDIGDVFKTTWLGQVVKQPELLFASYENGSVIDYSTGQWVNPQDGSPARLVPESGWLPSNTIEQQKVFETSLIADLRSYEDIAKGIAPVAYTPGRMLARVWYSPDEANYNLVSGLADMAVITVADPANLIPMNWIPKAGKALYVASRSVPVLGERLPVRAFEAFDPGQAEKIVVATRTPRPGQAANATAASRAGVKDALAEGVPQVVDESLPGTSIGPGGRLTGVSPEGLPTNVRASRFVVGRTAWEWLHSGQGSRVVSGIAGIDNFYDMYHMLGGAKSGIDVETVKELVRASTDDAVRQALGSRLGTELVDKRPFGALGAGSFRRAFGYGVNGAMLDSVGLLTAAGRDAFGANREMLAERGVTGAAGAFRAATGAYRRPFRLSPYVGHSTDARDREDLIAQLDAFARGGRLSREDVKDGMNNVANANAGPELYNALYGDGTEGRSAGLLGKTLRDVLKAKHGLSDEDARQLSTVFAGGLDERARNVLSRDLAWGAGIDNPDGYAHAQLLGEALSNAVHLPAYRDMTRATRGLRSAQALSKVQKGGDAVADFLQAATTAWRSGVLVRPAYIPREVGELLFSMSLAGGHSAFTHPARFTAAMWNMMVGLEFNNAILRAATAPAKRIDRAVTQGFDRLDDLLLANAAHSKDYLYLSMGMRRLAPLVHQNAARLSGSPMWDDINRAIQAGDMDKLEELSFAALASIGGSKQIDQGRSVVAGKYTYAVKRDAERGSRENRDYMTDLVHKVWILSGDSQMRDLANPALTFDEALARFRASPELKDLRVMHPDQLTDDPQSEIDYLMQYSAWLNQVTGGDPEVMEAIATGYFRGEQVQAVGSIKNARAGVASPAGAKRAAKSNASLRRHLEDLVDADDTKNLFPEALTGYRYKGDGIGGFDKAFESVNKFVDGFFDTTGGFADIFARGPAFREAYAERVMGMVPHMSAAAKADAVAKLREAGDYALAKQVLNTKGGKGGFLGIEDVDHIALGFALRESKRLFYDAARRQNYAVMLRVIGPFLQATTNTFRRWGQLSYQNPQMLYRTLKPIHALSQPGSASIYQIVGEYTGDEALASLYNAENPQHYYTPGSPDLTVDGFFFTDSYGDKRFAFPMVGRIAQLFGAENAVLFGTAGGLNVAGNSISPGVGPVVTFLQSQVVSPGMLEGDNLVGEALRFVNPYGLPDSDLANSIVQSVAPTWARKGFEGTTDEYAANATVKIMGSLAASGQYDLEDERDVERMIGDAKRLGTGLSVLGFISTAFTPASSTASMMVPVEDADGGRRRLVLQDRILQEFRKYTAQDYNNGLVAFTEDYGYAALYAVLPKTKAAEGSELMGYSTSDDVWQFRTDHPAAYKENSDVIGLFFAGGDPDSEFSQNLYRWQKAEGERVPKTPEEFSQDVNQALGWMLWDAANRSLVASGLDDAGRSAARTDARRGLAAMFPGWTGKAEDLGRFDLRMDRLVDALDTPEVRGLASSGPIADYVVTRSEIISALQAEQGTADLTTKAARPYAARLLAAADEIAAGDESGGFMTAWDRLFSAEFDWES